jgi:hypothetical protein
VTLIQEWLEMDLSSQSDFDSAVSFGNLFYCDESGVRWDEVSGIDWNSPSASNTCLGGIRFGCAVTRNLSSLNITDCEAFSYSCVSSVNADNVRYSSTTMMIVAKYLEFEFPLILLLTQS